MVIATHIQFTGASSELVIPAKTADVLAWLRTKLKNPNLQYQGKIQDKERWITVFGSPGSDTDDSVNQHMLPGALQEETFVGSLVMMATTSEEQDEYDLHASAYVNLTSEEYDVVYSSWTFQDEEDEEGAEGGEDGDEVVVDEDVEEIEEEEAEEEIEEEKPKAVKKEKKAVVQTDVFTECPLRSVVKARFHELITETGLVNEMELALLKRCDREAKEAYINVSWSDTQFWNLYRIRAISLYENLKGKTGYVENTENWVERIRSGEITPTQFAEFNAVDLFPARWKAEIERQIEKDKHLFTNSATASIYMYCSSCKKKAKCDYYQLQTRSADEPMTTFVTCLECDRRWKF